VEKFKAQILSFWKKILVFCVATAMTKKFPKFPTGVAGEGFNRIFSQNSP